MAYARLVTEGDGSTTQFAVNFALDYLLKADVTCRVGTEADGLGDPVYRTLTWNNPNLVTIGGAVVADGVQIVFQRRVDRESLRVMFEDGDVLNETNLDNMQKQLIMLVHEVLDDSVNFGADIAALELAVAGLITTVNASLAAALDTAQDIADAAAASALAASGSASSASASAASAATIYDTFDDRYLGAKAANPTLDNDGNALITGALYWNSVSTQMRAWSGSAWVIAYNPATGTVDSVHGRTGVVIGANGDYTASQITNVPSGNLAATTVQAALDELQTDINGRAATSHTHTASQISDSTTVGRALLMAVDAAAQRTALSIGAIGLLASVAFSNLAAAAVGTTAEFLANTASKLVSVATAWAAAVPVALTSGTTITPDFNAGANFTLTLAHTATLANPTNQKDGQCGVIAIAQDGTGSRTLSYGTHWKFAGGTAPVLTTTAGAIDLLYYWVQANGTIHASLAKDSK